MYDFYEGGGGGGCSALLYWSTVSPQIVSLMGIVSNELHSFVIYVFGAAVLSLAYHFHAANNKLFNGNGVSRKTKEWS